MTKIPYSITGFSLLEVIVMISIIGIAANFGFSMITKPSNHLVFERFTQLLCATLQTTRSLAISTNSETIVIFNMQRNSYSSLISKDTAFPNDLYVTFNYRNSYFNASNRNFITFFPDGSSDGANINISMHRFNANIHVNWLTGLVSCQIH